MARLRRESVRGFGNLGDYYIYFLKPDDKKAASELLTNRVIALFNGAVLTDTKLGPFVSSKPARHILDLINARASHLETCAKRKNSPIPIVQWAKDRKVS